MIEDLSDGILLKASDEEFGFRVLYDRYWEILYRKAFSRLGNSDDAQDAVQEIFLTLWRNRDNIYVDKTILPYLFTALKYYIIKQVYRKAKKGEQLPLSVEKLEQHSISTEEIIQYKELQEIVTKEIEELPQRMREIYRLSRIENLRIFEIAERLHLSEQTVKNTLSTTLKRLQKKLSQYSYFSIFIL